MEGYPTVGRDDHAAVVRAVRDAGGPELQLVASLGPGAHGAALVRWPDGHEGILKRHDPLPPGAPTSGDGTMAQAIELADRARAVGVPAPRTELVLALADGAAASVQERAFGVPVEVVTPGLVDQLLELADRRRGLLRGTSFAARPLDLYLTHDGPGFCLHGPLRDHDDRTRGLLRDIQVQGAAQRDPVPTDDLVHLDYHPGNVLVHPEDPSVVTAVVDWEGARAGPIAIDLAILAFDLSWRDAAESARVARHLTATTEPVLLRSVWAHAALRLVDWSLRHFPGDLDHWLAVSRRYV